MASLKQIKTKIRSVQKTGTVTKAMEAVSAAKMRKAQGRAIASRAPLIPEFCAQYLPKHQIQTPQ